MKVKAYRRILLLAIFIVIIATASAYQFHKNNSPINQSGANTVASYMYILKECDEKIGIFKTGETIPFKTIDVYIFTLPTADQIKLQKGIYIQNDEELKMIIEDYES